MTTGLTCLRAGRGASGCPGRKTEDGSTLVEFALIVIVFMVMLLAIIDFSRALYTYHFLDNAAKSATRWAAVNGYTCGDDNSCNGTAGMNNGPATAANIVDYVKGRVPSGIDPNKITTTVSWPLQTVGPAFCNSASAYYIAPNYPGCTVQVHVSYDFSFLYPLIRSTSVTMSASSEMIITH